MQPYLKELIIWWEVKHRIKFNIYALLLGLFGIALLKTCGLSVNFFMLPFVGKLRSAVAAGFSPQYFV